MKINRNAPTPKQDEDLQSVINGSKSYEQYAKKWNVK